MPRFLDFTTLYFRLIQSCLAACLDLGIARDFYINLTFAILLSVAS